MKTAIFYTQLEIASIYLKNNFNKPVPRPVLKDIIYLRLKLTSLKYEKFYYNIFVFNIRNE